MLTLPAAEEKKSKYLDFKEAFMKEIEIFIQEQRIYSQIVVETKLKDGKNTNRKKNWLEMNYWMAIFWNF